MQGITHCPYPYASGQKILIVTVNVVSIVFKNYVKFQVFQVKQFEISCFSIYLIKQLRSLEIIY